MAIVFVYLLNLLSPVLGPFFFSALLAYLGDPVVDQLEKRMSRTLSVSVVFVAILLILILTIAIFIPLVSEQLSGLLRKTPKIIEFTHHKIIPLLEENFHYQPGSSKDALLGIVRNNLSDIPSLASKMLKWLTGSGEYFFALLANIFLVPVVTFYLLRDWDILMAKIHALLPRHQEAKITQIARESNEMLSAFLRGQFAVMNALGLIYAIGLSVLGVDSAILIGFIAGWLSFVPYLGLVIGLGVATVLAYFQFNDLLHPLGVVVVFVFAQALEGSVLTPRFVGERIGLHPVAVIFAVLAGGQLAGFAGVLLALPVAAVLNVLISHVQLAYQQSKLYNDS
ncbi:MAG: AI-2E family transporter [Gammaproteobacteria bacterium]|nr:MAG: AI-2E family transporter [Gammaproteobacteria bacterium]